MTTVLAHGRPGATCGRTTFTALAAREMRRFIVNPVFLLAVAIMVWGWASPPGATTEIDSVNPYSAIFFGGFGMMATFWLTRSMRSSEPVVGVTPVTLPARTAALCTVAIVPAGFGWLALFFFLRTYPIGDPLYGAFSPSARIAILIGQMVIPALGGPLLGIALGRWVRFPGAAFVLFLIIYGWVTLVTVLSFSRAGANSALVTVLRLFAPFAFFTYSGDSGGGLTTWRGSPWFFLGWQVALCAIAVLVAVLRGAEGRSRFRTMRTLWIVLGLAAILLGLAAAGGFTHPVTA
jgi:hypothetical protein